MKFESYSQPKHLHKIHAEFPNQSLDAYSKEVVAELPSIDSLPFGKPNLWALIGTFVMLSLGLGLMILFYADLEAYHQEQSQSLLGQIVISFGISLVVLKAILFLYQVKLFLSYKPVAPVSPELLPSVSVIVPAYNEGKQVYDTLLSLSKSDYPKEKLQLLAIDDGSKDDTWYWMNQAKKVLGDRVAIFQQPQNMGKRHALYRGFHLGNGEIFVTVDSDSTVDPDTLHQLVSPFVTNPNCGAVAGNIRVLNKENGIIPRMLNVSFVMSFEFMRSIESAAKTVFCTPGALAAYKRTSVFNCLEEWINQSFLGQPSDIGEDRAMTNMILKQGADVVFQKNAYAYTNVPEKYTGLYKMFIRWDRSNVRESLAMGKFVFSNFRKGPKFATRVLFLQQTFRLVFALPLLVLMFAFIVTHPLLFLATALTGVLIYSTFPVLFFANRYEGRESIWAYTYSIFYTFSLFWITPYSLVTAHKRGWLTRDIAAA